MHATVSDEVARVLHTKKVLACRHRLVGGIVIRELFLQQVVQRVTGLFIPLEVERCHRLSICLRCLEIKTTVGVHGQAVTSATCHLKQSLRDLPRNKL